MVDVSQFELQILQAIGIAGGAMAIFLVQRAARWLGVKMTSEERAALDSAVDKMMTLGVTRADAVIREKGWDHIDSKNSVINVALPILETKFSDTLTRVGIDMASPEGRLRVIHIMERMWPDLALRLSASPVTPPTPPTVPPVLAVVHSASAPAPAV